MMKAPAMEDGIFSYHRNQSNKGGFTARSTPGIRSLTILTNQSHPAAGNESQNRLKLLEFSIKRAEEPVSIEPVSLYIPSSLANRSDQQMSEYDSEEEGNSTRKFCGQLKPDNFADQKFERDQVMLSIPSKKEQSVSSRSSEYKTCEYYESPEVIKRQAIHHLQIMQDNSCLSPLILKKMENDILRSGSKPFSLSSSLKKVKKNSQEEQQS